MHIGAGEKGDSARAMALMVMLPDGFTPSATRAAASPQAVPVIVDVPAAFREGDWDHELVEDARAQSRAMPWEMAALGFYSALRVRSASTASWRRGSACWRASRASTRRSTR
jgi:hypothetical protein